MDIADTDDIDDEFDKFLEAQSLGEFYLNETVKSQRLSGENAEYEPARKLWKYPLTSILYGT